MADSSNQECREPNCSHFVKNVVFYRYRYLMSIFAGIFLVLVWFAFLYHTQVRSQRQVIQTHSQFYNEIKDQFLIKSDSLHSYNDDILRIHLDECKHTVTTLLEMQYDKIQSEYTVLSLWAGVLMIVFLVFSIYSMFKVDEMQKQSRDLLENIESTKNKAKDISKKIEEDSAKKIEELDKKSNAEIEAIKKTSSEKMRDLEDKIRDIQNEFSESVNKKTSDFENAINKYKEQLENSAKTNNDLIKGLVDIIQNSSSSSKESQEN